MATIAGVAGFAPAKRRRARKEGDPAPRRSQHQQTEAGNDAAVAAVIAAATNGGTVLPPGMAVVMGPNGPRVIKKRIRRSYAQIAADNAAAEAASAADAAALAAAAALDAAAGGTGHVAAAVASSSAAAAAAAAAAAGGSAPNRALSDAPPRLALSGAEIIVLVPGTSTLKFGLAEESAPHVWPMIVACRNYAAAANSQTKLATKTTSPLRASAATASQAVASSSSAAAAAATAPTTAAIATVAGTNAVGANDSGVQSVGDGSPQSLSHKEQTQLEQLDRRRERAVNEWESTLRKRRKAQNPPRTNAFFEESTPVYTDRNAVTVLSAEFVAVPPPVAVFAAAATAAAGTNAGANGTAAVGVAASPAPAASAAAAAPLTPKPQTPIASATSLRTTMTAALAGGGFGMAATHASAAANEERVRWTDVSHRPAYVTGEPALHICPSEPYTTFHPFARGSYAIDTLSYPECATLIERIIYDAVTIELKIHPSQFERYSAAVVLPDKWNPREVYEFVDLMFSRFGFREVFVHRESVCSCFGSGIPSACVVDIGAGKTHVCCVEEGTVIQRSNISLCYGGDDVDDLLAYALRRATDHHFSATAVLPATPSPTAGLPEYVRAQITALKERLCTLKWMRDGAEVPMQTGALFEWQPAAVTAAAPAPPALMSDSDAPIVTVPSGQVVRHRFNLSSAMAIPALGLFQPALFAPYQRTSVRSAPPYSTLVAVDHSDYLAEKFLNESPFAIHTARGYDLASAQVIPDLAAAAAAARGKPHAAGAAAPILPLPPLPTSAPIVISKTGTGLTLTLNRASNLPAAAAPAATAAAAATAAPAGASADAAKAKRRRAPSSGAAKKRVRTNPAAAAATAPNAAAAPTASAAGPPGPGEDAHVPPSGPPLPPLPAAPVVLPSVNAAANLPPLPPIPGGVVVVNPLAVALPELPPIPPAAPAAAGTARTPNAGARQLSAAGVPAARRVNSNAGAGIDEKRSVSSAAAAAAGAGAAILPPLPPAQAAAPLSLWELNESVRSPLQTAITQSIGRCPKVDTRRVVASHILIVGGSALIPGLISHATDKVVNALLQSDPALYGGGGRDDSILLETDVKGVDSRFCSWKGCSIVARSLDASKEQWIRRTEWLKRGISLIRERAPFHW